MREQENTVWEKASPLVLKVTCSTIVRVIRDWEIGNNRGLDSSLRRLCSVTLRFWSLSTRDSRVHRRAFPVGITHQARSNNEQE